MSQALSTIPSFSSVITSSSSSCNNKLTSRSRSSPTSSPCLKLQASSSLPQNASLDAPTANTTTLSPVSRRNSIALGIGAVLGLSINGETTAWAATRRRAVAAPTEEQKKDPNIGDEMKDKVLATKKKVEDAVKQAIENVKDDDSSTVQESVEKKIGESSIIKKAKEESPIKRVKEQLPDDSFPPTDSEPQPNQP